MGALLNVDYSDELTRLRVQEIIRYIQRLGLPVKLNKIPMEYIADSFYTHYRVPILSAAPKDENEALWYVFLKSYISSDLYQEISKLSKYNYSISRSASVKLLRAYNSLLSRIERGTVQGMKEGDEKNVQRLMNNQSLRQEISNLLRFYMGNVKNLDKIRKSISKILGDDVGKEVADLLFDVDIDPYRARLAKILESLVKILAKVDPYVEEGAVFERAGVPSGIRSIRSFSDLRKVTNLSKAIYRASPTLFAYKLATRSLSVKDVSLDTREKIYMLVDKSGSMFYSVYDGFAMDMTQKITWATALAVALMRHSRKVILRFFDQMVYPQLTNIKDVIKALLRVLPLGGTDITSAVHTAVMDSKNAGLRSYKLVIITDGEDDFVNPEVLRQAKTAFRDVKALLIGGSNSVIESEIPTIRIDSTDIESLKYILKNI
ncbi:hypothetical protein TUZN_0379 [Thermoproteus uzoniensis 768-20]|uniref:VWA containing CoxE family protein n=1 Tax=Thermoproteus uzoniensis (strain 768-20) TaxID=999630 RepID=F2L2T7_THEU7|nr:hypothetical protein [Thermoproteus uzoniensis]AEA11875.1 hypothetical protein TUZN_0379 [Thermoproteus uzoniensis 768-20]